jgi:uncharacterized protein
MTKAGQQPLRRQPQRSCAACRRVESKRGLVRIVRSADGGAQIDETGKAAGRGMYLCRSVVCWEQGLRRRVIERSLRIERLSAQDLAALSAFLQQLRAEAVGNEDEEQRAAP